MKTWRWMFVMVAVGAVAAACTVETKNDDGDDDGSGASGGAGGATASSSSSAAVTGTGGGGGGGTNNTQPELFAPRFQVTIVANGADLDVTGIAEYTLLTMEQEQLCQELFTFTAKIAVPGDAECAGGSCANLCPGEVGGQTPAAVCVGSFQDIVADAASYNTDCNYADDQKEAFFHPNNASALANMGTYLFSTPLEMDLDILGTPANGTWGAFADSRRMGDFATWSNGFSVTRGIKDAAGIWQPDDMNTILSGLSLQAQAPVDNSGVGEHIIVSGLVFGI